MGGRLRVCFKLGFVLASGLQPDTDEEGGTVRKQH
jgi:hypothetical protein